MKTAIREYDGFFIPIVKKNFFSDWEGIEFKDGKVDTWNSYETMMKRCKQKYIDDAKFVIDEYYLQNPKKSAIKKTIIYP